MSSNISKIVVFGGTGAQGIPVVKELTKDGKYHVRIQTRDPTHSNTKEFEGFPNITYVKGQIESEPDLRKAMEGMDGVFFLANGFAIGEKSELFWSIRAFEIAIQSNVKFFVYSGLDYVSKKGNYDEKYRCGHYDAKGRISEWIKYQPLDRMKWSILTSGPYMEMMNMMWKPFFNAETSTYEFIVPLGDGAIPMIHLEDLGKYARWIFDNPDKSAGLDLEIATQHVKFDEVAKAFTNVTGKKAIYKSVPIEAWLDNVVTETASSAYQVDANDPSAMTWKKNFTGWYNVFRDSVGPNPVIARDYDMLDKILPTRVRTIEEWMRKVNYDGSAKPILKDRIDRNGADRYKGALRNNEGSIQIVNE